MKKILLVVVCLLGSRCLLAWQDTSGKAAQVVELAIEALGGDAYLNVREVHSDGRYFFFRKGRKGFTHYWDWTVYAPVKWRFQLGKGKRQQVQIYNLEIGKGWTLEGKDTVEEVPEEQVQDFRESVKEDVDLLLRHRRGEEGMSLYYFGPDDIAGEGQYEAVEFLDETNSSVVVFFDLKSHLPVKVETHSTDELGVRHKRETEFSNWHTIEGVATPLRQDVFLDGEISQQRFVENLTYSPSHSPDLFLEPVIKQKK